MSIVDEHSIGERLREERELRGWSQSMLAEKIGTTVGNINGWEHGRHIPSPYFKEKLSEAFGLPVKEIFSLPAKKTTPPIFHVPHLRNLYFTGRDDILHELHDAFARGKSVALTQPFAINGLGGIGKSQIAIEYAYRYRDEYNSVLWIVADSLERLISEFVTLATVLDLPTKNDKDIQLVLSTVTRWLQRQTHWLLIFDNADNMEAVLDFIPPGGKGDILITTRSQFVGNNIERVAVDKLERNEAILFLLRRTGAIAQIGSLDEAAEIDIREAEAIYESLDGLPLALNQAASYIVEKNCSLQDYHAHYPSRQKEMIEWYSKLSQRDYPKSVATTWLLSFKHIEQQSPVAIDILSICAFLHPDSIPEEFFLAGAAHLGSNLQDITDDHLKIYEAIGVLRKYSLVQHHPDTKTLRMHRLVQVVIKDRMGDTEQKQWTERIVRALMPLFPKVKVATWSVCERYVPHVLAAGTYIEQWHIVLPEAGELLDRAGFFLRERGRYTLAEPLLTKAVAIFKELLGLWHTDTANCIDHLASLYESQGKYEQAEQQFKQVLRIKRKLVGKEHNDTLATMNNLGLIYNYWGKYHQSERLLKQSLKLRKKLHGGLQHEEVARSINNLAVLYNNIGKYRQAKRLLTQAIPIWEQIDGADQQELAHSLSNLAFTYLQTGEYDKAEELYVQVLAIREAVLTSAHPLFAMTLNDLAACYRRQGKFQEAEAPLQRALIICKNALPHEHPDRGYILTNFANLYIEIGEYDKAEEHIDEAIRIRKKVLAPNHPSIASSLSSKGQLRQRHKQFNDAEKLYKEALTIWEKTLPKDDAKVISCRKLLIEVLQKVGKDAEADEQEQLLTQK